MERKNRSWSESCASEEVQKIILHVYDDESKEFTSLTTYHGMIRIYTSTTWPSRIFWTLVVVTCLTLFMIQGGVLLQFYNSHPTTYQMHKFPLTAKHYPFITVCPSEFRESKDLYDIIIFNVHGSFEKSYNNISTRQIVDTLSYKCEEFIDDVRIGGIKVENACSEDSATPVLTDLGKCYTFNIWRKSRTKFIDITFSEASLNGYSVRLHDRMEKPASVLKTMWIRKSVSSLISFHISEKILLHRSNWGTCENEDNGNLYETGRCYESCLGSSFNKICNCTPFYIDSSSKYCTMSQLNDCLPVIQNTTTSSCKCPVQCYDVEYHMTQPSVSRNTQNKTQLRINLNSNSIRSYEQYKRFKQIDLMSYVGGVMGLFLGMSCVTLLEVFIYLFKTVFGTLNDNRHQKFVEGMLGKAENENDRSHEEIIITKKIDSHRPDRKQSEITIEDDINDRRRLTSISRRMSQITLPNDNIGLRIQLYKHSHDMRRSSYIGACDF